MCNRMYVCHLSALSATTPSTQGPLSLSTTICSHTSSRISALGFRLKCKCICLQQHQLKPQSARTCILTTHKHTHTNSPPHDTHTHVYTPQLLELLQENVGIRKTPSDESRRSRSRRYQSHVPSAATGAQDHSACVQGCPLHVLASLHVLAECCVLSRCSSTRLMTVSDMAESEAPRATRCRRAS